MSSSTLYRVEAVRGGWLAHAGDDERWFDDRDTAIRWCHDQAVKSGPDAAPEEGAYGEADIEIDEIAGEVGQIRDVGEDVDDGEDLGDRDDG